MPPHGSGRTHEAAVAAASADGSCAPRVNTSAPAWSRAGTGAYGVLLAALFLLPLYPKISLVSISGTYVPIRLDDIITVGAMVAWGSSLIVERRRPQVPPVTGQALGWLLAGLVALLVGAELQHTISASTGTFYWAKPIEYLFLGWMTFDLVARRRRLDSTLAVILVSATIVLIYGLLQSPGSVPAPPTYLPGSATGRVTSTFADPHELGVYLGLIAILVVSVWHLAPILVRSIGALFLIVLAYVLVQTGVRSEFVVLLVVAIALLWWRETRVASAILAVSLVTFLAAPSIAGGVGHWLGPGNPLAARIGGDLSQDVSLATRFQVKWPELLRIVWSHPLFGGGPSAATEAADGYYVRSLVEVGVIGTIAFLFLLGTVVSGLWAVFIRGSGLSRWLAFAALFGTILVAGVGVLIDTWVASRPMQLYWPLVGAALAGRMSPNCQRVAPPEQSPGRL